MGATMSAMTYWDWVITGLMGTGSFLAGFVTQHIMINRTRHGGGKPLPAWLITAESASPALRELVARMARSEAKNVMVEWSTLPPGLQKAIRMEIAKMVAEAFAIHNGRRN